MSYLSFEEIKERLKKLDEVTLLEVLNLSSEDLVERFSDMIEDRYEQFIEDLESWDVTDDNHSS